MTGLAGVPTRPAGYPIREADSLGVQAPSENAMRCLAEVLDAHSAAHPSAKAHNRAFYLALPHECAPPLERGREWSCVAAAGGVSKRERERVELRCGCWWRPKAWPGLGTPCSPLTRTSPGGEKPSDAPAAHPVRNRFLVSSYRPRALTPQRTVTQVDAMETNLHLARAHVDTRVWCVTQSVAAYLQLVEAAVHERNRLEPPGTREAVRSVLAPLHPYATYCLHP